MEQIVQLLFVAYEEATEGKIDELVNFPPIS